MWFYYYLTPAATAAAQKPVTGAESDLVRAATAMGNHLMVRILKAIVIVTTRGNLQSLRNLKCRKVVIEVIVIVVAKGKSTA